MKKFINSCLSEMDISYIAKSKEINSLLDYYRIIFRTSNMKYHKLEIFYNSSDLFAKMGNSNLLGNSDCINDLRDKVINSIIDYENYEECKVEMNKLVTNEMIASFLSSFVDKMKSEIKEINLTDLSFIKVEVFLKPIGCISILYSIEGVVKEPMKLFLGKSNHNSYYTPKERLLFDLVEEIINGGVEECP